ncbi:MAG: hypothetical protein WD904_06025 [Dehalococcoidia bacterium]
MWAPLAVLLGMLGTMLLISEPWNPRESDGSVDFGRPLAEDTQVRVGGRRYVIPRGATVNEGIYEYPVDSVTGEFVGDGPFHNHVWTIERGGSLVRIDADTGEVFELDMLGGVRPPLRLG